MIRRILPLASILLASQAPTLWADIPIQATRVVSGLSSPIFVTQAPGDNDRLFIVEQGAGGSASVQIFKYSTGTVNTNPFVTVSGLATGGEQGLLGMAFHPDYASNGQFYLHYTDSAARINVVGYTRTSADTASSTGQQVIRFDHPQGNHNAGWIGFGKDRMLYISSGDGGNGWDAGDGHTDGIGNAQDMTKLLGKMLRVDVGGDDFPTDSLKNYRIPANNPFRTTAGVAPEIWASGLRNPWRNSFDKVTGDLYIADVGQGSWEEVSYQRGNSPGGENYGWRAMEGNASTGLTPVPPQPPRVDPIHVYPNPSDGYAITGGYVYRGSENSAFNGHYIFGDFGSERIWSFVYDGATKSKFRELTYEITTDVGAINSIASFGEDNLGRLYAVDINGEVFRFIPAMPGDADLSGTVDITDLGILASYWQTSGSLWENGDFSDDGVVDITDLGILASNWQAGVGLGEALATVGLQGVTTPEPASVALMVLPALMLPRPLNRKRDGVHHR